MGGMMACLHPYLPYHPEETMTSFVRRLSLFHTGQGPQRLLADLGINPTDVHRGAEAALRALAASSGVEMATIEKATIGRIERSRTFRGERWSRDFVKPEGQRICPHCVVEDTGSGGVHYQRSQIVWRLRPISTCAVHHCALVEVDTTQGDKELEAPSFSLCELQGLAEQTTTQNPTSLEEWVLAKLSGALPNGGEWLDGQTIEQGVRVCEMLGCVLNDGIHVDLKGMTAAELRQNALVGFEVAKSGAQSVTAALDQIRQSSNSQAGQAGPKAMYGKLFEWLAYRNPIVDPGPIKELLREHILDHTAIDTGEFLLGREVTKRRCHSVYSLSIATEIHPKRLRKILENRGLIPEGCAGVALNLLVFPAEETEKFCRELLDTISLNQLPFEIGGSRTQVTNLHRDGTINAIIERDADLGIGRIDFARVEIESFLSKIDKLPLVETPAETIDLTSVTKRTGLSTGQIMKHVFAGKVAAFRNSDRIGIDSIRVTIADLWEFKSRMMAET
ncbi:MAG: hypothetical protein ACI9PU_000303 [Ascidiaceihabitans sp.]